MLCELGNNLPANFEILVVTSRPKKGPLRLQAYLRKGSREDRKWRLGMGKDLHLGGTYIT